MNYPPLSAFNYGWDTLIDYSRRARLRPRIGLEDVKESAGRTDEGDPLMSGQLESIMALNGRLQD